MYVNEKNKGFTLIEILIAMSIISLIVIAFFTILNSTIRGNYKNEREIKCMNLVQSEVENIRQQIKNEKLIKIEDLTTKQLIEIKLGDEVSKSIRVKKYIENDSTLYYEDVEIYQDKIEKDSIINYLYTITVRVNYDEEKLDQGIGKEITTKVFSKKDY